VYRVDALNLAELLRTNQVKPVHHEKHGTLALKELGRSYLTLTKDRDARFEGSISQRDPALCALGTESLISRYAPSDNQK
jgi:hypothetical protein